MGEDQEWMAAFTIVLRGSSVYEARDHWAYCPIVLVCTQPTEQSPN